MSSHIPEFSLPNAGVGPDPFSLSALSDDVAFVVLFFQRDHYCTNCRKQVRDVAERYDEFRARNAEVVSIVPEPLDMVEEWQDSYDLPYPLLADPDTRVGDAYDQPVRFGLLGAFSDFFGRMPKVVIVDRRETDPKVVYAYEGSSTFDRPAVEDLLAQLDTLRDETAE